MSGYGFTDMAYVIRQELTGLFSSWAEASELESPEVKIDMRGAELNGNCLTLVAEVRL